MKKRKEELKAPPNTHARPNHNYGGSLINQKYSPLEDIQIDQGFNYLNLIAHRQSILGSPIEISFTYPIGNIEQLPKGVAPFVVISSNRSTWMVERFYSFRKYLKAKQKYREPFNTFNSNIPFVDKRPGLLYDPLRTGRPLIILVHQEELEKYKEKLIKLQSLLKQPKSEFILIGWNIKSGQQMLTGFGASRFAAIKLLKENNFSKGWLIDDDVIHLKNAPEAIDSLEAYMIAGNVAAVGFGGATRKSSLEELTTVSNSITPTKVPKWEAGLAQQFVLWNIDELITRNVNFNPYFISSNEDISFCALLNYIPDSVRIIKYYSIIKLEPQVDKQSSLTDITISLLGSLYDHEKEYKIAGAPIYQFLARYANTYHSFPHASSQMVEQLSSCSISMNPRRSINLFCDTMPVAVQTQILSPTGATDIRILAGATGASLNIGVTGPRGSTSINLSIGPTGATGAFSSLSMTGATGLTEFNIPTDVPVADASFYLSGPTGPAEMHYSSDHTGNSGSFYTRGVTGPTGAYYLSGPTGTNLSVYSIGATGATGMYYSADATRATLSVHIIGPTGASSDHYQFRPDNNNVPPFAPLRSATMHDFLSGTSSSSQPRSNNHYSAKPLRSKIPQHHQQHYNRAKNSYSYRSHQNHR